MLVVVRIIAQVRSVVGPAQAGVTTHEALRLLGLTRTDASIDRVEAGRLLTWHAHDRQKQLRGFRLVEPTSQGTCRFTEVVEVRLLGALRPFGPLVVWLLRRQNRPDLRRLKHLLEARTPADQPRRGRRPGP